MKATLAAGLFASAILGAFPAAAPAQQQRIKQVIIYGNDPCPPSSGDEIVVCARRPETERYRIPPEVSPRGDNKPENRSWSARARSLNDVADTGIDSCSTVGPGGQTGCLQEMIDNSRVGIDADNPDKPPEAPQG